MNIFMLNEDPKASAQDQCDEHIRKMYIESGQMLSTAHRMLDGYVVRRPSKSGKTTINYWRHPDDQMETCLYGAVHHNHPSSIWTRESKDNYVWHYRHFEALLDEFTHRFGKVTKTDVQLRYPLSQIPKNIPDIGPTPFRLAMGSNPECMFPDDPVKSYRAFYHTKQERFAMNWNKNRSAPDWFNKAA